MRNEADLSPSALAHFVQGELASSLRSRKPYNVNLLLGGVDPITHKPSLYWLDYLAALAPVPYAAHGYAQYVLHSSSRVSPLSRSLWLTMMPSKVLLPVHLGQAPPPGHLIRTRHEDSEHVYR
jgi:hypothetical protein